MTTIDSSSDKTLSIDAQENNVDALGPPRIRFLRETIAHDNEFQGEGGAFNLKTPCQFHLHKQFSRIIRSRPNRGEKATGIIELVLCGRGQHLQRERTTITEVPQARMIDQLNNKGKGAYVEVEAILRIRQGSDVGGVWRRLSCW